MAHLATARSRHRPANRGRPRPRFPRSGRPADGANARRAAKRLGKMASPRARKPRRKSRALAIAPGVGQKIPEQAAELERPLPCLTRKAPRLLFGLRQREALEVEIQARSAARARQVAVTVSYAASHWTDPTAPEIARYQASTTVTGAEQEGPKIDSRRVGAFEGRAFGPERTERQTQ
jgi:hypothetical protein